MKVTQILAEDMTYQAIQELSNDQKTFQKYLIVVLQLIGSVERRNGRGASSVPRGKIEGTVMCGGSAVENLGPHGH